MRKGAMRDVKVVAVGACLDSRGRRLTTKMPDYRACGLAGPVGERGELGSVCRSGNIMTQAYLVPMRMSARPSLSFERIVQL